MGLPRKPQGIEKELMDWANDPFSSANICGNRYVGMKWRCMLPTGHTGDCDYHRPNPHAKALCEVRTHCGEPVIDDEPTLSHNAAVALGKLGGKVKSERKAASSRENGKKGGRPRKLTNPKP